MIKFLRIRRLAITVWLLHSLVGFWLVATGQELSEERFVINREGQQLKLPYAANYPIDQANEKIERIVFSIHGINTNAVTYYKNMLSAAEAVPGAVEKTLIIGPQLMTEAAAEAMNANSDDLVWGSSSERFWGGQSSNKIGDEQPFSISSFAVMDELLAHLTEPELFPNLQKVVIAGHSGGGQFVNRYAIASPFEDEIRKNRNLEFCYVVAQPSTHTYLTAERAVNLDEEPWEFAELSPQKIEACPNFNDYGYGLEALESWPYMKKVGADLMKERYRMREVVYFHGVEDVLKKHLARSCGANLQGANRYQRGRTYFAYINHLYGSGNHRHSFVEVPGVGHDHARMWASSQGLHVIFDHEP